MSRLSRFKKAPAIKLPKMGSVTRQVKDEDDDSDDDFVSKPATCKAKLSSEVENKGPTSSCVESSVSEYFKNDEEEPPKCRAVRRKPVEEPKKPKHKDAEAVSKPKPRCPAPKSNKKCAKSEEPAVDDPGQENGDIQGDSKAKGLCPFCGKKFGDKMAATSHIKSCAKDVPTEQVLAAMQLQEKQIEEWQKLGLEFPGFTGDPAGNGKKPRARAGCGGNRRKKKPDDVNNDDEYQLAMALSMSLHEELETRQEKQNQFLIESGLEKEVKLVEKKPPIPEPFRKPDARPSSTVATVVRRRGKKIQLDQLPLYTVDEEEKKKIIGDRVSKILDEAEQRKDEQVYIRDPVPVACFGVPKSLVAFQDKESTLWTRSQLDGELPNDSFSVLEKPDLVGVQLNMSQNHRTSGKKPGDEELDKNTKSTEELPDGGACEMEKVAELPPEGVQVRSRPRRFSTTSSSSSHRSQSVSLKHGDLFPRVIQDVLSMLIGRKFTDMVLYGREERVIKAHSFMLRARCPQIMENAVEEMVDGRRRAVIPLTDYSHKAVKTFLKMVYTGAALEETREVLEEAKQLAEEFGLNMNENEGQQQKRPVLSSVEVQTERQEICDAETMTEAIPEVPAAAPLDVSLESQEMFTTYMEDKEDQVEIAEASAVGTELKKDDTVLNDSVVCLSDDGGNDSVDLFEELEREESLKLSMVEADKNGDIISDKDSTEDEEEIKEVTVIEPPKDLNNTAEEEAKENISSLAGAPVENSLYPDIDEFIGDLSSPQTQWRPSSDKKRSRSQSPIIDENGSKFSATQIAAILEHHGNGGNAEELLQANKKLKLDKSVKDSGVNTSESENVVATPFCNLTDDEDDGDKWGNCDDDIFLECVEAVASSSRVFCNKTPKQNKLKSGRSVSTPNLSSPIVDSFNYKSSPFHCKQNTEPDPFADGCDDSVFANIPAEIFTETKSPAAEQQRFKSTSIHKYMDVSRRSSSQMNLSKTPTSSHRRRKKLSPKDLTSAEDEFSTTTAKSQRKGRGGGGAKAKAGPKLKLPSKLTQSKSSFRTGPDEDSSSYQDGSVFMSQPVPAATSKPKPGVTAGGSNKSPMLNYSLLDTPVLKQELKKFGIRPLPRNKAKAMLKHIYKETHK